MGKISLPDNYKATRDEEVHYFRAQSDRQAWYQAYEWADGELIDSLCEIDENQTPIRYLMEDKT